MGALFLYNEDTEETQRSAEVCIVRQQITFQRHLKATHAFAVE